MNKISPGRLASYEILLRIEDHRAFSSILLPVYEENLSARDRGLCHELTLGVLRRKFYLDKIIEKLTGKKINKLDSEVVIVLRSGLYQLLYLDRVPDYSVINDSVNLVKQAKKKSAAGLVNAVLRRASREKDLTVEYADDCERISVETSHPVWLLNHWANQFGWPETEALAVANNELPQNVFRLTARFYGLPLLKKREILEQLDELELLESELVPDCFVIKKSAESLRELAHNGIIYFQDEASQLVSKLIDLKPGERFLDVCAAPGSKITDIGALIANRESSYPSDLQKLYAGDFNLQRVRTLRENCANQGLESINILQLDALQLLPFKDEVFDAVLVDAPCSGTGTIRHNPEIRYFLAESDFDTLSAKQLKILSNASKLVKRGGRLIYSTCSLELRENEDVVEEFLGSEPGFGRISHSLPNDFMTTDGDARTFPHKYSSDGFFISVLEKN